MKPTASITLIFFYNLGPIFALECEDPPNKDYCVLKGQNGKEMPNGEVPLEVNADIGVSVKDFSILVGTIWW